MKNCKTLPQNLFLKAVLLLFVSAGLFTTPQDAPASVNNITIISAAGSDDTYELGDTIQAAVEFNAEVNVEVNPENADKKPQLTLRIGTADRNATFDSRKNGNILAFAYTVTAADVDTDGIEIPANSLTLNGGTITETVSGKSVDLKHSALPVQASHKVDGVVPTIAATNGIAITSTPTANNTYKRDEKIQATVTFTENVVVIGTPELTLQIGSGTGPAKYISGTGSAALVFEYKVATGDTDNLGIFIAADALSLNGGAIKDVAGNAAILSHAAVPADSAHKVDAAIPDVNSIVITSATAPYIADEVIQATVTFSESVNVTGTPLLTLKIGTENKNAAYTKGTGTKQLIFEYTVAAGDTDTDGIEIEADKLTLNGGTIKDTVGNAATLTHKALSAQASHKVDAVAPTITTDSIFIAVTSTARHNDTYTPDDKIQVAVTFTENVYVTGNPQLTLKIGTTDKKADFKRVSLTAIVFEYTVAAGDTDTDGISVEADSLTLNGGTIKDAVGNAATLTHKVLSAQVSHKVDGIPPTVATNGIAITSTPTSNNTYKIGDTIQATVTFTENVYVTGNPQLTLKIGTTDKNMGYTTGNGTAKLVFEYTVATGDTDTDGIEIEANKLSGGTIVDQVGNIGSAKTLGHKALPAQASHKVDGVVPTVDTNGIAITSTPTSNNTYKIDEKIQATVTFTENVDVTGTPQLKLTIGAGTKTANYKSGTGTAALVFEYTVVAGDADADGISIAADALSLNSGTIGDAGGNPATLTHTALPNNASHKVDTSIPEIVLNGVVITSTTAPYIADEVVQATVTFTENVTVTGTPQLAIEIGTATKAADYASGTGTTALVFEYTVAAGDTDADGISIAPNALSLNSGTIKDAGGNAAILTHTAISAQTAHIVDTTAPEIVSNGVAITSTTAHYKTGEVIQATVTFNDNVEVTGTPQLAIEIGTATKAADYASGTGTTALVFEYTAAAGDTDTDGISIAANALSLNSGTIGDAAGNAATLTHTALSADPAHQVDTTNPSINSIAFTSTTAPYTAGEVVQTTVTFTEKVFVTGTPRLPLQFSVLKKPAAYKSGNGTAALVFEYTVVAGEMDADGISIDADALTLNGGTIKDVVGNNANLTHTAIPAQAAHIVDTEKPRINALRITSTPTNNTYKTGDVIQVTVDWSKAVTVTGSPTIELSIERQIRTLSYASGSNSKALVFSYTVTAGDTDETGIGIAAGQIVLGNGVTINQQGKTTAAILNHPGLPDDPSHKVDTTAPAIVADGITITSTGAPYTAGEVVQATVTFTENVTVTGTPQLNLQIGTATKAADYTSGTGTTALLFEYTVVAGDTDADGISIGANALALNSGTLQDATGNAATLTHTALSAQASHSVDGTVPTIDPNGIAITSTPPSNSIYTAGDTIQITVTFSENVDVTGTPQLTLRIGTADKNAAYTSGTGTTALVFAYTVVASDVDTDGIEIRADVLTLNGGTIKDAAGNAATLTYNALSAQASHKVDGTTPAINSIAITSTPTSNNTYKAGDTIQATVTFSENMVVTGTPQLALRIGDATKTADYASGSGTTALVFEYTVATGDMDADGISIAANALNSGTIKDTTGSPAILTHTAVSDDASHKVDSSKPNIVSNGIAITSTPPSNNIYTEDDVIQATVTFSENVDVTGTPQLTLRIGTADKNANYTNGTGTTRLVFAYTVVASDADADGVEIRADKLTLNGGTIKDAAGNAATLTHNALSPQALHKVDGTVPAINGIAITSTPTSNNTYKADDTIQATVTFTENMVVTGTPQLVLQIGTATKTADYVSGTGSAVLVFEYTVATGDTDADGVSITADALTLNGGTIKDTIGSSAILTHTAVSDDSSHQVDSIKPTLNSIQITSRAGDDATYMLGNVIQVSIIMSEVVKVTGTPKLTLTIGAQNRLADYQSGGGTATLEFAYTVVAADMDTDGISIDANTLSLNGGTIKDAAGNAAVLTHSAVPDDSSHKVDTEPPKIVNGSSDAEGAFGTSGPGVVLRALNTEVVSNGVEITSSGPYGIGDVVQITVTFSERVNVTGTPQIQLQIGGTIKNAGYQSGDETDKIIFAYTIESGDADVDGISIRANSIQLNGGSITDIPGNSADLKHSEVSAELPHRVDTTLLKISSLAFSTTGPYKTSDNIEVTVTTTKRVTVTGDVTLKVMIGNTEKSANYHSGSGTNRLAFRYTVTAGDNDTNGISVSLNSLVLNGGTIKDELGRNLDLNHDALPDAGDTYQVDTTSPQVRSLAFTSTGPYGVGDEIEITLTTSEAVEVIGTPTLGITIGTTQRVARLLGGTGTSRLVFRYEVTAADQDDPNGVSVPANSLSHNSGTITDAVGNDLNLNHNAIPNAGATQTVRTTVPSIRSLAFTSTGPYGTSDRIQVTVTTTKSVIVTGSATLKIIIGHTEKPARYHSGSRTNTLVFEYTVASGDGDDSDGVSVRANSLALNGGTIVDEFGTALNLSHDALPDAGERHRVDTTLPQVSSLAFTSTGPYGISDNIEVTLMTSEPVEVTGTPTLDITIGTTQRAARLFAGARTATLVFRYEVTATDQDDANGVSISTNSLALNGGTIMDALGTPLNLSHSPLPDAGERQRVDTTSPQVSSLALTSTGPYGVGNNIEITLTTNEAVEVIGTPTLGVVIGATERAARFFGGTGTSTLVFRYEVTAADEDDPNGVSVPANSLTLNGGTITDGVRNDLNLNHSGVADAGNTQIVRMTIPSIRSLAFTSTGPYGISDNIEVTLTTTKPVTVTGSATLKIIIGHTEKSARYHSGSGTNRLVFQYIVASSDGDDTNGISVRANSLALNGGTIVDELDTALNLNHDSIPDAGESQRVDTTLPQVSSLAFTTTGPYTVDSDILVTVTTSEAITVAGSPTLTIVIGSTERTAHFLNSSVPTTLVFRYRVTAADKDDTNGVSVKANSLTLNGGTITDSVGNDLNLNHSGIANAGDAQIVGTTVSDIRSLAFTSTGPYAVDDTITLTVETTEKVTVTGIPRIPMTLGTATKYANYVSGSETTSLVFQYTVVTGDEDADGVEIAQNALENYNGSKVENSYRIDLNLNHPSLVADPKHKVDTQPPSIASVDFSSDARAVYTAGSKIEVVLTFEETGVEVTSTPGGDMPSVTLLFGDNSVADSRKTEVEAYYTEARPGSTKLIFTYTVTSDTPIDTDGIQIKSRSLKLPAGTSIQDASGNVIRATQTADGSEMVNIRTLRQTASKPVLSAVTSTGIIFNEFLNANTNKDDWVELRNITDEEISLDGWELNLSSTSAGRTDTFEFPEITLRAGAALLLINTQHKENRLERSQAYTYHYFIVPKLQLRGADFSLVLRDGSGAIVDVVGNQFQNTEASDTSTRLFEQNEAYFREQPNTPGYEATAWQRSGYQGGLGYDRNTTKTQSLGTPGYLKSVFTQQSETSPVSISEIMFTAGTSKQLPQWIELYNGSKTEVITLQGWRLQVEVYDPDNKPTHRFVSLIIHTALQILPNQTVLLVTKNGRHSEHFPEQRVYNFMEQNSDQFEQLGPDGQLMGEVGYAVVLRDASGNQVDSAGNLDGERSTNDEPDWKLPNCIVNDGDRTSIIRQYEDGLPLIGTRKSSWFRAVTTKRRITIYWGHPKDIGYPGWKKGGPLPVQLSSFSAARTEQGAVIKWTTQSELENAGFNVLRSDTKTGTFKVVNSRMLQGAGTTSERHTYQYVDTTAKAGVAYYYRLEEVSFAGVRQSVATRRLRGHVSAANRYLTTFGSIKSTE